MQLLQLGLHAVLGEAGVVAEVDRVVVHHLVQLDDEPLAAGVDRDRAGRRSSRIVHGGFIQLSGLYALASACTAMEPSALSTTRRNAGGSRAPRRPSYSTEQFATSTRIPRRTRPTGPSVGVRCAGVRHEEVHMVVSNTRRSLQAACSCCTSSAPSSGSAPCSSTAIYGAADQEAPGVARASPSSRPTSASRRSASTSSTACSCSASCSCSRATTRGSSPRPGSGCRWCSSSWRIGVSHGVLLPAVKRMGVLMREMVDAGPPAARRRDRRRRSPRCQALGTRVGASGAILDILMIVDPRRSWSGSRAI